MKYLIIIVCIILAGCSTKPTKGGSTKSTNDSIENVSKAPVVIDITKRPERQITLEDISNIEYIPLETNDSTLVNQSLPSIVSNKYIVYKSSNGSILVFNRQGKILYTFNRRGGGPEEYKAIYNIVLDEEKEELYVEDIYILKIHVYSIDGKFKRSLNLPRKFFAKCLMNYDKDYLFCYNVYFLDHTEESGEIMNQEDFKSRDNPYFFISKQTGEITPLNYTIPNRIGSQTNVMKNGKRTGLMNLNIYPLAQNTPNIMITEFADDTLYSLKNRELVPVMIKKPSVHKMNPPILVSIDLFTDRYIFILAYEKKFDEDRISTISMIYDKQTDNFYRIGTLLPISFPMRGGIRALPNNTGITSLSAERLFLDYKAGKLEGELKEIASKLKEDDNPVLMLIKIKE